MIDTPYLDNHDVFKPLTLAHGAALNNRFALAPLSNTQSGVDGVMSKDEHRWLTMRAQGGFGMKITAAAHIQEAGQGYSGQVGAFDDRQPPGLSRVATDIKAVGSGAYLHLTHSGRQALEVVRRVGPSTDAETGACGLSGDEVEARMGVFVAAVIRAQKAGFDGVEMYLCPFPDFVTDNGETASKAAER